jgi:hypothetical protein
MHFKIVKSGWCFKTNRTTVMDMRFSCLLRMVLQNKSNNSTVHHALQNCQIRMVLQNKSDNSTVHHALQNCQIRMVLQNKSDSNGHALKIVKKNFAKIKIFAKTFAKTKIVAKIFRKRKFSRNEISRKLAHFRFSQKWKKPFSFQPNWSVSLT